MSKSGLRSPLFTPVCRIYYKDCFREFMLVIHASGKVAEHLAFLQPHRSQDCHRGFNLKRSILKIIFFGIPLVVLINIVLFKLYLRFFKNNRISEDTDSLEKRKWLLNPKGRYELDPNRETSD
ncbi:hypothetical protein RF11_04653 [Thelohanellus kitauei]|uniref:Uncharacterized protein n=1 Tax=Thelohanellus kitauei TaxID=669202 RepID=A0A0C2MRU6_THEKT|nr:hypothetical protein RF11_04653 [Thelohanellus kitauei]